MIVRDATLQQYRAIATRYDKTARNFLGAIHLAASIVWFADPGNPATPSELIDDTPYFHAQSNS